MSIPLPVPGAEAQHHELLMTLDQLLTRGNYRPLVGFTTWPPVKYEDIARSLEQGNTMVVDRRPTRSYQAGCLIDGPCEGGFVSIDVNMITMSPTDEEAGQYHRSGRGSKEWVHYPDPSTAPKPRTNYGYYKSVVDFGPENRNKMWNLLTAMRTSLAGDPRPAFLILARKDYKFSIPPGYFPKDIDWTKECEPSLLVKISDYKIPANGRLAFQDMLEDAPFEDVLFSLSSSRTPRAPPSNFNMFTFNGDGIYPVQIIKNDEGVVICVKVHFHSRDMYIPHWGDAESENALDAMNDPNNTDTMVYALAMAFTTMLPRGPRRMFPGMFPSGPGRRR